MGAYIADRVMRLMTQRSIHVVGADILIMGLTFKENCPDLRNTRVIDIINEFKSLNANVDVYDPWVDVQEAKNEYGVAVIKEPPKAQYDAIILAVSHGEFKALGVEAIRAYGKPVHVLYDVKYLLPANEVDGRL